MRHTFVLIGVQVMQTTSVETGRASDDTVDLIALGEKEFGAKRWSDKTREVENARRTGRSHPGQ